MSKRKHKRPSLGAYVAVPKRIMDTPAWRAMSPGARLLWIELRRWLRNDGRNNGGVFLVCRDAAKAIGTKSTRSVVRWYAENEHHGFLVKTAHGFLGSDGHGIGDRYRFTDLAHGTHPPTRDYEKWEGELFAYTPRHAVRKKQKPVSLGDTRRVPRGHIRNLNGTPSVCVPQGHIEEAISCAPRGHGTSFPSPCAAPEHEQGSSTARAPALAGGAGSTPAPVSKPKPTEPEPGSDLPSFLAAGEPAAKRPWLTPTVEEVPWDTLPTEVRMLVLGLPDAGLPPQVGAVPDVPDQAEKAPPAAELIDVAEKATREANPSAETAQPPASVTVPSSEADCVVCGGDLYRCFPLKCPLRKRLH